MTKENTVCGPPGLEATANAATPKSAATEQLLLSALTNLLALLNDPKHGVVVETMGATLPLIAFLSTPTSHTVLSEAQDAIRKATDQ